MAKNFPDCGSLLKVTDSLDMVPTSNLFSCIDSAVGQHAGDGKDGRL